MNGMEVKKKLEAAGFNPNVVAADLNISHQVMYWRLAAKEVKVSFLLDLCRVTGLSLSHFLENYIDTDCDKLRQEISEKDKIIVSQAMEINSLKNKIKELEKHN